MTGLLAALLLKAPAAFAGPASSSSAALQLDYPELQMTPLMSERIERESIREVDTDWTRLIPLQASALLATTAGIVQLASSDGSNVLVLKSGLAATGIGAAQLVTTVVLSAMYHPYAAGKAELKQTTGTTARDRLARERYAEENIEAAARVGRILTWVTVLPNLVTSAGITCSSIIAGQAWSPAMIMGAVSVAGSLLPLLFPTRWQLVAGEQADYKKRIYGPLGAWGVSDVTVAAAPLPTSGTEWIPGLQATIHF